MFSPSLVRKVGFQKIIPGKGKKEPNAKGILKSTIDRSVVIRGDSETSGFPSTDSLELNRKHLKTKPYGRNSVNSSQESLSTAGLYISHSEGLSRVHGGGNREKLSETSSSNHSSVSLTSQSALGKPELDSPRSPVLGTFPVAPPTQEYAYQSYVSRPYYQPYTSHYEDTPKPGIELRITKYPKYRRQNNLGKKLQPLYASQAEVLHRTLGQTFLKNIFLNFKDPYLSRPLISALQKKLGFQIPIVHFPAHYDPITSKTTMDEILQAIFEEGQSRCDNAKPVIFLKGLNARALKGFANEVENNPISRRQNVQLIVDVSKARSEERENAYGYERDRSVKVPKSFTEMTIPSLSPSQWLSVLPNSYETDFLQGKYRCTLTLPQLSRLLRKISQKNNNNLSKSKVLESLDSLGSFIRAKYKLDRSSPIQVIQEADLEKFFQEESLNKVSEGPIKVQDSMDLKQDFSQVVGFDEAKAAVNQVATRFKYPALHKKLQSNRQADGMLQTMLINGVPGVGKTLLAETSAKQLEMMTGKPVSFISTEGRHFAKVRDHYNGGEQAVEEFFYQIRHADNDIVVAFIDEIDAMRSLDASDDKLNTVIDTEMKAASSAFLTGVQSLRNNPGGKQILLISATNRKEKLSEASRDRYDFRLDIKELPKNAEQKQILVNKLKENNLTFTDKLVDYIAEKFESGGYNGRNLQSLAEQLAAEAFERMSNKTLKNEQLDSGEIEDVPLKLTKPIVDSVMERFKAARQNGREWNDESRRAFGFV